MTAPDRDAAVAAFDNLAALSRRDAATVGDYLDHLEALNHRLAQHAANAGKVLEDGKRELMKAGWVAAWMTLNNDPDRIHDNPLIAFDVTYGAMEEANNE